MKQKLPPQVQVFQKNSPLFKKVLLSNAKKITPFEKNSKNTFLVNSSGKSGKRFLQNETIQKWH